MDSTFIKIVTAVAVAFGVGAATKKLVVRKAERLEPRLISSHAVTRSHFWNSFPTRVSDHLPQQTLGTCFSRAEPAIVNRLAAGLPIRTETDVLNVMGQEVAKTLENHPMATFEVLSGKLKVHGSLDIHGFEVGAGEVNVYKTAGPVAAAIAFCPTLTVQGFKDCASSAIVSLAIELRTAGLKGRVVANESNFRDLTVEIVNC